MIATLPRTAHHLSPQALKWKEYRRRNPLGVERIPGGHTGNLEHRSGGLPRPPRRNVFDFPSALSGHTLGRLNGAHNFTDGVGTNGRLLRCVKSRLGYISTKFVKGFKVPKNALFDGHWQNTAPGFLGEQICYRFRKVKVAATFALLKVPEGLSCF